MRKLYSRGLAMTAGALVAVAGGAVAVTAATTTTPATTTPATTTHHHHRRHCRPSKMIGTLTAYAGPAGTPGTVGSYGTITIKQPDGTSFTLDLTAHTKFLEFQGHGKKPLTGSGITLSGANVGNVVAVTGRQLFSTNPKAKHLVGQVLDLTQ